MQSSYNDMKEYKEVIRPIIKDEWMYSAFHFKRNNEICGIITHLLPIEDLSTELQSVAVEFLVAETSFWTVKNPSCLCVFNLKSGLKVCLLQLCKYLNS